LRLFDWDKKTNFSRFILIITSPLLILQHLTIPWAEKNKYFRPFYIIHPPFILLLIFFTFDGWTWQVVVNGHFFGYWITFLLPFTLIISFIIFLTSERNTPPVYDPIFVALGVLTSALWIDVIADELVSCLSTLGKLFNVSEAIMGLTVMAWGNSLSDLVTDVLVAKKGLSAMATSAIYSSPITHVLMGLGLSFLIKTTNLKGTLYLEMNGKTPDLTNTLWLNLMFLLGGLLLSIIIIPASNFRFTKILGAILLTVYLSSILISLLDLLKVVNFGESLWKM